MTTLVYIDGCPSDDEELVCRVYWQLIYVPRNEKISVTAHFTKPVHTLQI